MPIPYELDRLCVVLVSTRNPLNIGAAARAMCNFGVRELRVVNPYDAAFREARSAVGAVALLADTRQFNTVADAVADCTLVVGTTAIGHRQLQHALNVVSLGASLIREEICGADKEMRRAAILFGSEKFGLSNEDLSHCNWLMHIPTSAEQPSMNLGQAVAVCLYEVVRSEMRSAQSEVVAPASAAEIERVTAGLLDALHASEYLPEQAADREDAVRRMIRRLHLSHEDATTWLGMLRQILWKLRTK